VPSLTDFHTEFLFTVLDRFVFGGKLAPGMEGNWPVLYNVRERDVTSVIQRYMGRECWGKPAFFII